MSERRMKTKAPEEHNQEQKNHQIKWTIEWNEEIKNHAEEKSSFLVHLKYFFFFYRGNNKALVNAPLWDSTNPRKIIVTETILSSSKFNDTQHINCLKLFFFFLNVVSETRRLRLEDSRQKKRRQASLTSSQDTKLLVTGIISSSL